jgi:hypothetical protein
LGWFSSACFTNQRAFCRAISSKFWSISFSDSFLSVRITFGIPNPAKALWGVHDSDETFPDLAAVDADSRKKIENALVYFAH